MRAAGGMRIQSNRGVALNAFDGPFITRGFDAFTSGAYAGHGRWGLFMEPANLIMGIPGYGSSGMQVVKYDPNSTVNAVLMRVNASGGVTATSFTSTSDRNLKENFIAISPSEVLEKVAGLEIRRWNFKGDNATPHLRPMAQDFYAAFGVGPDDKHIATVDADGVALAAIQGLNRKLEDKLYQKETEITQLKHELEKLK